LQGAFSLLLVAGFSQFRDGGLKPDSGSTLKRASHYPRGCIRP